MRTHLLWPSKNVQMLINTQLIVYLFFCLITLGHWARIGFIKALSRPPVLSSVLGGRGYTFRELQSVIPVLSEHTAGFLLLRSQCISRHLFHFILRASTLRSRHRELFFELANNNLNEESKLRPGHKTFNQ